MKIPMSLKMSNFLGCLVLCAGLLVGCSSLNNKNKLDLQTVEEISLAEKNMEAFYQMRPAEQTNLIKSGDNLKIEILNDPSLSNTYAVGNNGIIQMPFIGDVNVNGVTANQLKERITQLYNDGYFVSPNVIVYHDSSIQIGKIVVDGAVSKPGVFELSNNMKFTEAIAKAGGVTDNARSDKIFVVRNINGERIAFPFDFQEIHLARVEDPVMLAEDVVYVQSAGEQFEADDLLKWLPLVNTAMLAAIRF